jgi:hypothetical protein
MPWTFFTIDLPIKTTKRALGAAGARSVQLAAERGPEDFTSPLEHRRYGDQASGLIVLLLDLIQLQPDRSC